uniref:Cadherin domain-containing protein n=1 Tax=Oryzias latipes TaxID=8090 RepID=A0A3P9IML4_ORYLA
MDNTSPRFALLTAFSLWFLIFQFKSTEAVDICSAPFSVPFPENNKVDDVVLTITVQPDVTLDFTPPPANPDNPFRLDGNQLRAVRVLDYETVKNYAVQLSCTQTNTGLSLPLTFVVLVENVNDNHPVFDQNLYLADVDELSPIGFTIGRFAATDLDQHPQLYYTLTSEPSAFKLQSPTIPAILVDATLNYEKVKEYQLKLVVQDTPLASAPDGPSFSATATIQISISDGDNRPPWFQPCTKYEVGGAVICESAGYTGTVNLNEQQTGALSLKPGPVHAIDGDTGINEEITYTFLSGNDDGLFAINPSTGDITMLRPADVLGEINLVVLAAQKINVDQFATTQVGIRVQEKSLHLPQFQRPLYEGLITSMGSVALDLKDDKKALRILATDEDYAVLEGINPHITYSFEESEDFVIINGFLFLVNDLTDDTFRLTVVAKDTSNDETATAQLVVDVKAVPAGGFGVEDMAALGATLGALLLVCLVVIGVLVHRMQKGKANWRKIYEASMFRSSLGQGPSDQKEAIQYTNEAFQMDEGGDGVDSGGPAGGLGVKAGEQPARDQHYGKKSSAPLHNLLPEDTSDTDSNKTDSEKEVKPILTKERRVEEGYKSVWFKEDIDPNAKEEVVIIPDNNDHDSEDEDNKPNAREDDEEGTSYKRKIAFADADLDSGLELRMGDQEDDSDSDRRSNTSL